jgi:hypothetical protein
MLIGANRYPVENFFAKKFVDRLRPIWHFDHGRCDLRDLEHRLKSDGRA